LQGQIILSLDLVIRLKHGKNKKVCLALLTAIGFDFV